MVKIPTESERAVYVGMAADLLHPGHINLLKIAAGYGRVTVGILTDEAIKSYKRPPLLPYSARATVISNLRMVSQVIPQDSLDYVPNLQRLRPDYVVHADDWKVGVQQQTRQDVIDCLTEWGGTLIEPPYTSGFSSTELHTALFKDIYADHLRSVLDLHSTPVKYSLHGARLATARVPLQLQKSPTFDVHQNGIILTFSETSIVLHNRFILYAHVITAIHDLQIPILVAIDDPVGISDTVRSLEALGCTGIMIACHTTNDIPLLLPVLSAIQSSALVCIIETNNSVLQSLQEEILIKDILASARPGQFGFCSTEALTPVPYSTVLHGCILDEPALTTNNMDFTVNKL